MVGNECTIWGQIDNRQQVTVVSKENEENEDEEEKKRKKSQNISIIYLR